MPPTIEQKISDFFSAYPQKHFAKRHILVQAGQTPTGVMFLVTGAVRQYDIAPSGAEVVINVFKPPAFFPMSWAINKTPNEYFFEAVEPVTLQLAPPDAVLAFLRKNPDVLLDLLSRVYRGVDGVLRRMTHLMGGTAQSRILYELIVQSKRFGVPDTAGLTRLRLSENDLAQRVGLTRETVNRNMRVLKSNGLVIVDKNGIVIPDISKLASQLEGTF